MLVNPDRLMRFGYARAQVCASSRSVLGPAVEMSM